MCLKSIFTHKLTTLHNHSPYCMNCVLDWSWQWDERTCSCNGNKTTFIPLALLLHPEIIRVCLVYSHFSTSVSTSLELALIPANFHTPVQTILFYLSCRHISLSLSLSDTLSLIAKVAPTHIIYETMLRHWQAFWRSKWVRESEERVTQDDERWIRNVKHAAWVPLQAQNASIATYFIAGFIYIAVECRWYWAWNHINL